MKYRAPIKGMTATSDDLDHMWHVINERRATTTSVKVEVERLVRVLTDFATYADQFKEVE